MTKNYTPLWVAAGIGFLTLCLVITLVVYHESQKKSFVERWDFGSYPSATCPPFGHLPISLANCLGSRPGEVCKPAEEESFGRAMSFWNDFGKKNGREVVFQSGISTDPLAIPFFHADKAHYNFGGRCELFRAGDNEFTSHALGWTNFVHTVRYRGSSVHMCLDKYKRGVEMLGTPTRRHLRRMEFWGFLAHEMGHLLLGPRGEMDPYGMLMSSSPTVREVAPVTAEIIRRKVFAGCPKE